ncbi:MAG: EF-Tu/IF-2/RF-3 family GTPase, partial [Microcystaceae cyanobacterium]
DPNTAVDKVFDLFVELGADDDQCDFTTLFASGLAGFAKENLEDDGVDMKPLFEAILHHVPPPAGDPTKPLQLQVTTLGYDNYLGRMIIGRIHNGTIQSGQQVALVKDTGAIVKGKVAKLFGFEGLQQVELPEASAGYIVAVAGFADANIGETLT